MLVGHEDKKAIFEKLAKEEKLSHAYLFFGEDQVGKKLFAKQLAAYIEKGDWGADQMLSEVKLIEATGSSIGIDEVRDAKRFLSQTPSLSSRRVLILDSADKLTPHAQNSILKIAEEPPATSLIILITSGIDSILPTLKSRLQKVYFSRVESAEIESLLVKQHQASKEKAKEIASLSMGRPGRAVDILTSPDFKEVEKLVKKFLSQRSGKRKLLDEMIKQERDGAQSGLIDDFISHLIAELAQDPIKNADALKDLSDRATKISDFSTNRRLQLETATWNL